MAEFKVLISREQIAQRVADMGDDINRDYGGAIVVLLVYSRGQRFFSAIWPGSSNRCHFRLHRCLQLRQPSKSCPGTEIGIGFHRRSPPDQRHGPIHDWKERHTGGRHSRYRPDPTYLKKMLMARKPKSLKIAALLDKPSRRKQPITATTWVSDSRRIRSRLRAGLRRKIAISRTSV